MGKKGKRKDYGEAKPKIPAQEQMQSTASAAPTSKPCKQPQTAAKTNETKSVQQRSERQTEQSAATTVPLPCNAQEQTSLAASGNVPVQPVSDKAAGCKKKRGKHHKEQKKQADEQKVVDEPKRQPDEEQVADAQASDAAHQQMDGKKEQEQMLLAATDVCVVDELCTPHTQEKGSDEEFQVVRRRGQKQKHVQRNEKDAKPTCAAAKQGLQLHHTSPHARGTVQQGIPGSVATAKQTQIRPQEQVRHQNQKLQEVPRPTLEEDLLLSAPTRKQLPGGTGRAILIETNHLALTWKKRLEVAIHYDVNITPNKPRRLFRRIWEAFKQKYIPKCPIAFDEAKNAFSPRLLSFGEYVEGEVEIAEDEFSLLKCYKVVVKFASEVNLNNLFEYLKNGGRQQIPQDALQCIDIVLRNAVAIRFVRVGRSYFSEPRNVILLGNGIEMWHGFYQSAIIGWKPFLNVDVEHKGFPIQQNVMDLIAELQGCRSQDELKQYEQHVEKDLNKFLKGLKIQYQIPGQPASRRTYRCNGVGGLPHIISFTDLNGRRTTVADYFKLEKQYSIRFDSFPCIWVGSKDKNVLLPAELCTIVRGQVTNYKLNEKQTGNMIRRAATSTEERKRKVLQAMGTANFNADPCVQAFGLSVGDQFEKVTARVLNPPRIQYSQNKEVLPVRGSWRAGRFFEAKYLNKWTVLNLGKSLQEQEIENFIRIIKKEALDVGVNINEPRKPFTTLEQRLLNLESLEKYFAGCEDCDIVFVIVPDSRHIYGKVKQAAELRLSCLTQCIKERTMKRMSSATASNILMKVNAKLNGKNHILGSTSRPPCFVRPCMIMGADVTHPSPDQSNIPSVAAVCASHDARAVSYNFCWRLQPAKQEIISDLEEIVIEQLRFFYRATRYKPERIIFFRDGVSEGQFSQVLNAEVRAIRKACKTLEQGYEPGITFLIVQKRHHTRLFPTNPADSEDSNKNVPVGTVVDTRIVHPTAIEYYLVSHASVKGVARPTKYRVLWDDSSMSENELQHLTYYLCHLYSRCTRSVSYPAPTYYAHLAAFRARVYLEGTDINLKNLQREQVERKISEILSQKQPMFFI